MMADELSKKPAHFTTLKNLSVADLSFEVLAYLGAIPNSEATSLSQTISIQQISVDYGLFKISSKSLAAQQVSVQQKEKQMVLSCTCLQTSTKVCEHQSAVLFTILQRPDLKVFFDKTLRFQKLKEFARDYGLEQEKELEKFFEIHFTDQKLVITPVMPSLLPVTSESLLSLKSLLTTPTYNDATTNYTDNPLARCIVIKQHRFYKHLFIELYDSLITKEGKLKNPLIAVPPQELIWQTQHLDEIKFYTAINRFQNNINSPKSALDINSLRAIVQNPFRLPVYYHQSEIAEKIIASSLVPIKLEAIGNSAEITVQLKGIFYEISGRLALHENVYDLGTVEIVFTYFILVNGTMFLVKDLQTLELIQFFKKKQGPILVHRSKFKEFRSQILEKLEEKTTVAYPYIPPATPAQLCQNGFDTKGEKIIYLVDAGVHVSIIPVMKYGEVEIPVRTNKRVYAHDKNGDEFMVERANSEEASFTGFIVRQHPDFEEQLDNDLIEFYLHKQYFLNEEWFLDVFEEWQNHSIEIFGFNEITGNKFNLNRAKITVQVISGINWFNVVINTKYGKQKASLKSIHKAIRDKSKYIQLGDGTIGILPAEWIEKFASYFQSADVTADDLLQIPKINYTTVQALYDEEMLSNEVQEEIQMYQQKLANFDSITEIDTPADLHATLRPYQKQGLNWLNFLDDLNFGGCLADDMGLGKTLQIIAFILSQRTKVKHNVNLLVVPTSLIFNWQAEVQKFAPSICLLTIHGAGREKSNRSFDDYEIILTSYGTLLSDINTIKKYYFNYIFLDESQNIKNPESQRYKAVRLLQSRNKIAITGTPIENNTLDIYGQLSFACPGLLGGKKYFRDVYSTPIDKFKVRKRTIELQQKIKPFILRRTKQEVATELPDKTEMILYCEMGAAQRKVYEAYEKEFREFISATTNEELPKKSMYVLKGLTRLRQICNSPFLLKEETVQETASAKIDSLIEQIESKIPYHKILIFSQFVAMLELIKEQLEIRNISYSWLTGTTKNRDVAVDRFQNSDDVKVFLISLKAGGTGLNLTAADYVYIVDLWWNPAVENQAIDRAYRIGQHKNVIAARLICPNTVEEKILKLQESKTALADKLFKDENSFVKSLDKEALLQLLE